MGITLPKLSAHFDEIEFLCKCPRHEGAGLISPKLVTVLENMRLIYGAPMRISSGFRCAQHNTEVGGKPDSAHLTGEAADIVCIFATDRYEMIKAAYDAGIRRFGVSFKYGFIHIDVRERLPQDVCFGYDE